MFDYTTTFRYVIAYLSAFCLYEGSLDFQLLNFISP